MKLFLVRHGESVYNRIRVHQRPTTPLSSRGKKQARLVARELGKVKPSIILSSKYTRAMQTAQIIGRALGKKVVYTELLNERKFPSEIAGKRAGALTAKIRRLEVKHIGDPSWHYSDDENEYELRSRALRALRFIKGTGKRSVLVVTHGVFLRTMLTTILLGKDARPEDYVRVRHMFESRNTGITELEADEKGKWRLLTFNDYSHLR